VVTGASGEVIAWIAPVGGYVSVSVLGGDAPGPYRDVRAALWALAARAR